jgi:carboxylesterase
MASLDNLRQTPHELILPGSGSNARTGVLLVHGLIGTPAEVRVLAKGLNKQGFTVYAVQLAGHCGTMDDLIATRWTDWLDSVASGLRRFRGHVDQVVVGGLSMGALLALAVAEDAPDLVAGVCALSTPFRYDGWSVPLYTRLSFLLPLFKWLGIGRHSMFLEQPPYGVKDDALRAHIARQMRDGHRGGATTLPGTPWWSVPELHRLSAHTYARLNLLRAPCLVLHAREDEISSVSNAQDIARLARNSQVELVLLDNCYHMITIDRERRVVIAKVTQFVAQIALAARGRAQENGIVPPAHPAFSASIA